MDDRLTDEGEIKELDNPISDEYDELIEEIDKFSKEFGIGIISIVALNKIMKDITKKVIKDKEQNKKCMI